MFWADNLVLLSSSEANVVSMAEQATKATRTWDLEWKPSSLELFCGVATARRSSKVPLPRRGSGGPLEFQ
eukprot:3592539-Lingulodinium_polyedra.AAC.1